jgi:hypothetical protein
MPVNRSENIEFNESAITMQTFVLLFVAIVAGLLIAIPLLPSWMPNLAYSFHSFGGKAPKIYWYLSRSAGFVALSILWISMALGLSITNKMARIWPGAPAAFAIHEYVSLLGLAFVSYHGLVLMGDHFVDFSLPHLLTPFSIEYQRFWVGLGQVGFYTWLIAALSFYVRQYIGQKTWRLIHYVNFATYSMGLFHGIFSGTDSKVNWARGYYWISGGSLLILLAYRIYDSALKNKFSLRKFVSRRVQAFTPVPTTATNAPIPPRVKSVPQALLLEQAQQPIAPTSKPNTPTLTPPPHPILNENVEQILMDKKLEPQASEKPAHEHQLPIPASTPALASAVSIPDVKASTPAPSVMREKTPFENIINVRIFKEPTTRPILELQRLMNTKQAGVHPLFIRVKQHLREIPVQPTTPNRLLRRVTLSED